MFYVGLRATKLTGNMVNVTRDERDSDNVYNVLNSLPRTFKLSTCITGISVCVWILLEDWRLSG